MKRLLLVLGACVLLGARGGSARGQARGDAPGEGVFPPQLLIEHADEIGLDDAQKDFVRDKAREAQERLPDLQRNLQQETAALSGMLREDHPDEHKVLDQLDRVLESERQIKRTRLSFALSIRERLTPEQQAKARELRQKLAAADGARRGDGTDWGRARTLNERDRRGEELTREERENLERARAERQQAGDAGRAPDGDRAGGDIDTNRVRTLSEKGRRGEKLTDEEQAYLDRAGAARERGGAATRPAERGEGDIDTRRVRELHEKSQRGERLTDEEKASLQRPRERMQRGRPDDAPREQGGGPAGGRPAIAGRESVDLTPLTQLKGDAKYEGQDGGLYGGGSNDPPPAHLKAAREAAAKVAPLDSGGKPAADGKVVLMSVGMSNTTQEFSRFKQIADADPGKSPRLLIVDAAQGGKDAAAWADLRDGKSNPVWGEADRRLHSAGVSPRQVQVIWVKQALAGPARQGEFPAHAKALQKDLETILTTARSRYPNLRLAYLSSRIYAGYAGTMLNPEPYAYEGAFAVRWVIEEQVKGDGSLNADPARGEVKAPVVLWGPYLWADGTKGREGDDLVWKREDFGPDGTHPGPSGRDKVARLLLKFFQTDPTAKVWFAAP